MIFHSSFEISYLWLPVAGFLIGLLATVIGAGGGLLFIFLLIILFNVEAPVAVTTSLAATIPIGLIGSVSHYRYGNINFRIGFLFTVFGITGAFLGAGITGLLTSAQLKTSFGIYTILLAVQLFYKNFRNRKSVSNIDLHQKFTRNNVAKGSFYGFLAGVITGTFGTSGAAPVLAGLLSLKLPVKLVIGTSLMIVLFNTLFALAAHFLVGQIDLTLVYFLGSGATIGAVTGPKLLSGRKRKVAEGQIRLWYAIGLAVIGILMILNKS